MKRNVTGQLFRPGAAPENVTLTFEDEKPVYKTVTVEATTYTVNERVYILVDDDTAGGAVTITLPPAIENTDEVRHIKKLGSTANVVVDGNASETIDGATASTITSQYGSLSLVCDGSSWWTL